MNKSEKLNLLGCLIALCILTPIVIYLHKEQNTKCHAKGGEPHLVYGKLLKCKLPNGEYISTNAP